MSTDYKVIIYPGIAASDRPYGSFRGEWNLSIQKDGELLFDLELLTSNARQWVDSSNWANGRYILDLVKYDEQGQEHNLETDDAQLIDTLLIQVQKGEIPVFNKFNEPHDRDYANTVIGFLQPRLPIAIKHYKENEPTVFGENIETHLGPPRDFRPLPRS